MWSTFICNHTGTGKWYIDSGGNQLRFRKWSDFPNRSIIDYNRKATFFFFRYTHENRLEFQESVRIISLLTTLHKNFFLSSFLSREHTSPLNWPTDIWVASQLSYWEHYSGIAKVKGSNPVFQVQVRGSFLQFIILTDLIDNNYPQWKKKRCRIRSHQNHFECNAESLVVIVVSSCHS